MRVYPNRVQMHPIPTTPGFAGIALPMEKPHGDRFTGNARCRRDEVRAVLWNLLPTPVAKRDPIAVEFRQVAGAAIVAKREGHR